MTVYYQGRENNKYNTILGALKAEYFLNDNIALKFISSIYHTAEEEQTDVIAQYSIGDVSSDFTKFFNTPEDLAHK